MQQGGWHAALEDGKISRHKYDIVVILQESVVKSDSQSYNWL